MQLFTILVSLGHSGEMGPAPGWAHRITDVACVSITSLLAGARLLSGEDPDHEPMCLCMYRIYIFNLILPAYRWLSSALPGLLVTFGLLGSLADQGDSSITRNTSIWQIESF